ncbi:hypothetical protein EYF80_046601 [Liparis tanakae]|uniref:Uncharacterized protein n=1 Tax=Liparis tanakae TaxID=230148 RepID=A0A4Z2FQP6_9TELE|nr:hypothetical protein EYF80_046601 [Liparis tanakae]
MRPLRDARLPLERILAMDCAKEGFSATISTVLMVQEARARARARALTVLRAFAFLPAAGRNHHHKETTKLAPL